MRRLRVIASVAALAGAVTLTGLSSIATAQVPNLREQRSVATCHAAGGHNMTAASYRFYASPSSVNWQGVTLNATRETWFRIDMLVNGQEVHRWRGLRNGSQRGADQALSVTEPVGSTLAATAFFANRSSCTVYQGS